MMTAASASAQQFVPRLGMELATGDPSASGSFPSTGVSLGSRVLFSAQNEEFGEEPWSTDGTPDGTFLLRDIFPGSQSSQVHSFTIFNDRAVFVANDGSGEAFWVTDGTSEGTILVYRDPSQTRLAAPVAVQGDRFYFRSGTSQDGEELWVSDTTGPGTHLVKRFKPGKVIGAMVGVGTKIYFSATAEDSAVEQTWVSDGTLEGTLPLTTARVQTYAPCTQLSADLGGLAIFGADSCGSSSQLWRSDGTPDGTVAIATFRATCGTSFSSHRFAVWNGRAWFGIGSPSSMAGLWSTDGTVEGTRREISDIRAITDIHVIRDHLAFVGVRASHTSLFFGDGSPSGTIAIADDSAGVSGTIVNTYTLQGGDFIALGSTTCELPGSTWITDGTREGTQAVANVPPLGILDGGYAVVAWKDPVTGTEPALYDGLSSPGTLRDIEHSPESSGALILGVLGNSVLFKRPLQGATAPLPILDLAHSTVELLNDVSVDSYAAAVFRDRLLVRGKSAAAGYEPVLVQLETPAAESVDVCAGPCSSEALPGLVAGQNVFYYAQSASQLMRSGGSVGSTSPVPLGNASIQSPLTGVCLGDRLIFSATTSDAGFEPWVTDGTPLGTFRLADTVPGASPAVPISSYAAAEDRVYFVSAGTLWMTDGTVAGTRSLGAITGSDVSPGVLLSAWGHYAYFLGKDETGSRSLWRTDGTSEGTRGLGHFELVSTPCRLGDTFLFFGFQKSTGYELWKSDGTSEGTRLVMDIGAGTRGSLPGERAIDGLAASGAPVNSMVTIGRHAFFSADDGIHGVELWVTDGTSEGTRVVADLWDGVAGSWPQDLHVAGTFLVYSAFTPDRGRETWIVSACPADFNASGFVDRDDFDDFALAFQAGDASADVDASGSVDTDDFDAFVGAFEEGC